MIDVVKSQTIYRLKQIDTRYAQLRFERKDIYSNVYTSEVDIIKMESTSSGKKLKAMARKRPLFRRLHSSNIIEEIKWIIYFLSMKKYTASIFYWIVII